MKKLVNLTPHDVNLYAADGATLLRTIPASGMVARVSSTPGAAETVDGIPVPVVGAPVWGQVEGLPAPIEGTMYIVSLIVAGRPEVSGRPDVLRPGTGPEDAPVRVQDGPRKGQIDGVTRLLRV